MIQMVHFLCVLWYVIYSLAPWYFKLAMTNSIYRQLDIIYSRQYISIIHGVFIWLANSADYRQKALLLINMQVPFTPGNRISSPLIESILESRVQSTVQSRVQSPGFVVSLYRHHSNPVHLQGLISLQKGQPPCHIGFNDIHRPLRWPQTAFATQVFKKTCTLIVCDVPLLRSSPGLGEVLHENQSNLNCFATGWSGISLMVLPEGALHVHLSHQVWPQKSEHCGKGKPSNMACAECKQMCMVWESIQGLKC